MDNVNIEQTLRPLRLAFLVRPNDTKSLLKAIEINTFLWGGQYNPTIPLLRRIPSSWKKRFASNAKPADLVKGYIDSYDPDFIVCFHKTDKEHSSCKNREVIYASDLIASIRNDGTISHGISAFEVLRHYYRKELRFKPSNLPKIVTPAFGHPYKLFLSSVFGSLCKEVEELYSKSGMYSALEFVDVDCSLTNFLDLLDPQNLFHRRMTSLYIGDVRTTNLHLGNSSVFVLDASQPLDVIDYLNLRATARNIIPIPIQVSDTESVLDQVFKFLAEETYRNPDNPADIRAATIIPSAHISKDQLDSFISDIRAVIAEQKSDAKFFTQPWYPHIWQNESQENVSYTIESDNVDRYDIRVSGDRATVDTLAPSFATKYPQSGGPHFANEVKVRIYSISELVAEVLPDDERTMHIPLFYPKWRLSKKGLVYLADFPRWNIHVPILNPTTVFSSWMKAKGWDIELSTAGRIATQMLKQLGGELYIGILATKGVIKLLSEHSEGKTIKKKALRDRIKQIANKEGLYDDGTRTIEGLINSRALQLGIECQCPTCQQRSWFSITEADYTLMCPKCLDSYEIPSGDPDALKWTYRTIGPFSLPNSAQGAYSVLLSLRFFRSVFEGATTTMMSFTARKSEGGAQKPLEADLGILFEESRYGAPKKIVIFAECKTFNLFEKKDVTRMSRLGREFPRCTLVFSTMKDKLSPDEIKLIKPLVNKARANRVAGRPYNNILILTSTELCADHNGLPTAWKKASDKHKQYASYNKDFFEICDRTNELYLGVEYWFTWRNKQPQFRKLIKKRPQQS